MTPPLTSADVGRKPIANQIKLNRRVLIGTGAVVALAGTAGLAFQGGPAHIARVQGDAKTLRRGNGAEPDTLDPHKASGNWENNIIGDMFMGLMTDNAAANPIPGAAESYSASADGLVYTFKLRDHKWSDGRPVTAQDYVFSLRRIMMPKTAAQYASILYPIKNAQEVNSGKLPVESLAVRALDERTLEIAFHFEVPYIAQLLTHYTSFAVPQHVVEKYGEDWLKPEHIATNGPYVLKEWVPNDHVRLEKNPYFYDKDNVKIETVYFNPTQDAAAALKRFRAGEFDLVTDSIPPQQVDWLRANMPKELRLYPFILNQYVQFNFKQKPFDDLRVRTALSMAIEREIIVSKITRAGEKPAYALIPPGMPDYPPVAHLNFKTMTSAARVAKAKTLLAQAGFGPNNPLTFDYNMQNTTEAKIVAVALQEMWRQVGAQVQLVPSESQVHYDLLRKHDFAAAWAGWIADYRDPKNYLFLFQSSTIDLNYGSYSNAKFDAVVEASDNERDAGRRAGLLVQAEQMLLDDVAVAPVYFGVTRDLVSTEVKGWVSNNVNINRTRFLSLDRTAA
ncbi:MAG TPA: peptide ABC transporter substrate-binding protein [Rhizomicrobium sp.]|nr:peptide ABC transporter substrate-binding protein [Rhizomicrobium sp.]